MNVAIAGAHGQVASRLGRLLVERGDRVIGLIRNSAHAQEVRAGGVDPVVCDLEVGTVAQIAAAVRGSAAVVVAAGAGPGSGAARKLTLDRDGAIKLLDATAADSSRYLILSTTGAEVSVADLRDERFVSFPPGATIRQAVERAAANAGYVPHAGIETNDVGRTAALVAEGLGVAVLPLTDASRGGPNTTAVPLRAPILRYEIFVAWRARRHLAPAAEALRSSLLDPTGHSHPGREVA